MLLDVPRTHPSAKQKLHAFMAKHEIQTHSAWHVQPDGGKWIAAHMPTIRKVGYGVTESSDLFDCMAKTCRLLDEAGYIYYGATEREAVELCCDDNDIPFEL